MLLVLLAATVSSHNSIYSCDRTVQFVALCIVFNYAWYEMEKYKFGDKIFSSFVSDGAVAK